MTSGAVGWVMFSAVRGSSQGSSHCDAQCAPCQIPTRPLMEERNLPAIARRLRLPWRSRASLLTSLPRDLTISGTGRGGVGPLELELDLHLVPLPLVLYVELGAGGHIDSLPGDLDLEPLARLQCIGKPSQLRHELRGGVYLLDVPVWFFAHPSSLVRECSASP